MNKKRGFVLWLLFFCLVFPMVLSAEEIVQVTGVVRLVGSGPLTELVISGPDREWYVVQGEEHLLRDLQHQTVTVEGVETTRSLRFAGGISAGDRYTLESIRIINVHRDK